MACAHLDAEVVGRQFHRGSGDRHYVRLDSYPAFEGYSLQVRCGLRGVAVVLYNALVWMCLVWRKGRGACAVCSIRVHA
jgi:hypothetical protein